MTLGVFVEWCEHDREDNLHVIADQIAKVLVVPKVESTFGDLEMGACDRFSQLVEEWFLDLGKLCGIHDLKDVFNLVEEHDFFGAVRLGPVPEQTEDDLLRSVRARREAMDMKKKQMRRDTL